MSRDSKVIIKDSDKLQLLIDSVVDYAVFMLDADGIVVSWNAGAERIKGYSASEIIGHPYARFFTQQDQDAGVPLNFLSKARREGRAEHEGWRTRRDGTLFWAHSILDAIRDAKGNVIGFAKISRDITAHHQAQQELIDSERQFRLLTSNLTDCALYMLDLNGIVVSRNAGAERIKGYAARDVIGTHFSRFYAEADRAAGLPARALGRAFETGKYAAEGWRVKKDGSMFWASVVIELLRDETGKAIGYAKITRDITDRREAKNALDAAHLQLIRSQKMESIGQLTAGLAHDFNNLLMIIGSQVRSLRKHAHDEARLAKACEAITLASERGTRITRQLLAFSRQQMLHPTSLDLIGRRDALQSLLASSVGQLIKLRISLPKDIWRINVDESEFELSLVNMALNARDAMPKGGDIVVAAENVVLRKDDAPANLEGEFVAITMSDTGGGIPENILPKIFDPFFTTKPIDKGTGLGLAQVLGFAQQSGGNVTVTSTMGIGTRITLYFPRSHATAVERTDSIGPVVNGSIGTVLVVDDDPDVAAASAGLVEDLGHTAVVASNAESALRALERNEKISLVFSDIVMPGTMNGFDLARAVRARYPDMPILLTTGFSPNALDETEFMVIRKPYDLGELSRSIAAATKGTPTDPASSNPVASH